MAVAIDFGFFVSGTIISAGQCQAGLNMQFRHGPGIMPNRNGFTLVEMIVVMLLVAIVSATVISRFVGGNAFNPTIVRDQLISMVRGAQQASLGRTGVNLTITPAASGQSLALVTSDSGGTIESIAVDLGGVSLSGDINDTDSCASTPGADNITNATPMTITFAELGNLGNSGVTGSIGAVNSALRICVNNDVLMSVCVSPSGFAYAGDCDT